MILDAAAVVAWYAALAATYRRVPLCNPPDVRRCCIRAMALAGADRALEPAAIFYAFADKRRAFPFAWKMMAGYLAEAQAAANGYELDADGPDLDSLCTEVLYRRMGWPEVRDWFAARLRRQAEP